MTGSFWVGAILLLLLAGLFLFLPGLFLRRRGDDVLSSNRDWFVQREAELEGALVDSGVDDSQREELLQDARLRLLEDTGDSAAGAPGDAGPAGGRYRVAGLAVLLALVSFILDAQLGASGDVTLKRRLENFPADGGEADYRRLMLEVESRAEQRPGNLYYQAMLGNFYMEEGDYRRASALYRGLAASAPNDAGAAARAAQAGFLAAGRKLSDRDQLLAERALSIDPHQRTALGLLGMVAFEQGEYQAAVTYWRRLLVMEDPDSSAAQMIQGVIARAEAAMTGGGVEQPPHAIAGAPATGAPAAESPASGTPAAGSPAAGSATGDSAVAGLGVTLRLELAQGARAAPGDTVFVFARNPALESRMPVAVKRLTAAQLPVTLRLDDGSSMAGQKISELAMVEVVARVSPSGQPGEQHATLQARLSDLPPGSGERVHTLVLKPVGES